MDNIISTAYKVLLAKADNSKNQLFTEQEIEEAVDKVLMLFGVSGAEAEQNRTKIVKAIQTRVNVAVSSSAAIYGADSSNWLTGERIEYDLNKKGFWNRYKRYLEEERSPEELKAVDSDTNNILGHLADPQSVGPQQKKGLVIGDVQSGKTSNYAGLICKAVDCGYKIIIVITGVLDTLRAQTQERLERDFVGASTNSNTDPNIPYGVSIYNAPENNELANIQPLTDCSNDFSIRNIDRNIPNFEIGNNVALLVIKKVSGPLKNVFDYFNKRLSDKQKSTLPVLVIDDEADNASPNTKDDDKPSAINEHIRNLLALFEHNSYVGYTATPYANIFINPYVSGDPDAMQDNMANQDLFPKDFIYCLGRPSKYVGAAKLFEDEGDSSEYDESVNTVQIIQEESEFVGVLKKMGSKKYQGQNLQLLDIPDSLKEAIRTFIISRAIRTLRGDDLKHCSMLIHATLGKKGHSEIKKRVAEYLKHIVEAIQAYIMLKEPQKRDATLSTLYETWLVQFEYNDIDETWEDVCKTLGSAEYMKRFKIYKENSSVDKKLRLDYSKEKGLTPIVIGGNSLARGLTLEGLCTSYFLRESKQYDTLMQMGRWFGYRPNYGDICRVFITERLKGYFAAISRATDELKDSIRLMNRAGKTPLEFGLRVRNSVGGLLITARNKMRSAQTRVEWLDYSGHLLESYIIPAGKDQTYANNAALHRFIQNLDTKYSRRVPNKDTESQCGIIWEDVNFQDIENYICSTQEMVVSPYINNEQLISFVRNQKNFDVCLIEVQSGKKVYLHDGTEVSVPCRLPLTGDKTYTFKKNHPFSKNHEMGYQTKATIEALKEQYRQQLKEEGKSTDKEISESSIPGKYYRSVPGRKNLMLISFVYVPSTEEASALNAERKGEKAKGNIARPIPIDKFTIPTSIFGFSFSHSAYAQSDKTLWTVNCVKLRLEQQPANENDEEDDEY